MLFFRVHFNESAFLDKAYNWPIKLWFNWLCNILNLRKISRIKLRKNIAEINNKINNRIIFKKIDRIFIINFLNLLRILRITFFLNLILEIFFKLKMLHNKKADPLLINIFYHDYHWVEHAGEFKEYKYF